MRTNLLTLLFLLPITLTAQSFQIDKIDVKDGLSNDYVLSIAQDKNGILWFATEWGLNRFDGKKVKVYKHHPDNPNSPDGNDLNKIIADTTDNTIWIATQRNGLSSFNCDTQTFTNYPTETDAKNSTRAFGITDLCLSADGDIWIATYGNGLKRLKKESNRIIHYNNLNIDGLLNARLWAVTDDLNGHLYIGHSLLGLSILSLNDNSIKHFMPDIENPTDMGEVVRQIYIDSKNNVWIATNRGLALYHPDREEFTVFKADSNNPNAIICDDIYCIQQINNELWIGTERGWVSTLSLSQSFTSPKKVKFKNTETKNLSADLAHSVVRCIFKDNYNNIWMGTNGEGINFISHKPRFFNTLTYSSIKGSNDHLSGKIIECIVNEDDGKRIWVGTSGGGIDLFENGKKVQNYNQENNKSKDNYLLSGFIDSNGDLWFGTSFQGLTKYNKKLDRFDSIPINKNRYNDQGYNHIFCIYEDHDKNLWIGTNGGIAVYDLTSGGIKKIANIEYGFANNLIRSIAQDEDNNYWVGTLIDGVIILTPELKVKKILCMNNGFISNGINHIYKDSFGSMWVATRNGVARFDAHQRDEFELMNEQNGLKDRYIRAIGEGAYNQIWISTNVGISQYNKQTGQFDNYDYYDGIPAGTFLSASVEKTKSGILYFGSQNGVCYFDTNNSPKEFEIPPIKITDFNIYNKKGLQLDQTINLSTNKKNILKYNENTFSIGFNVMDYSLRNKIEYAYSLQGFENSWYRSEDQKQVTFQNIPYGKYEFQVKGRTKGEEWSEAAVLPFEITPPFWLSWWAKLLYVLTVTTIIVAIARFYKRKLQLENQLYVEKENHKKEQELNDDKLKFYTNVAHELRTPLTLIIGPLEDLICSLPLFRTVHN